MKIRVVTSQSRFVCDRLKTGAIAAPLVALSALILSGCSLADLPSGKVDAVSPVASGTPIAASPSPAAGEFSFPNANCGDQASTPSENWYPVYIDHGSLDEIHSKYCGDAISAIRDKTGTPSVQVASFTSYGKAQRFALAVGGVVEAIPTAQSPAANGATGASPSPSIAAASPQASTQAGTSAGTQTAQSQTAQSATLASDSGSPINIRSSASTTANVATVGYGGDRLQIVNKKQGDDGYTWYSVRLASGDTGWVRGDFVSQATASSADSGSSASGSSASGSAAISSASPSATASPASSADSSTSSGTATLAASEPGSPINVRDRASTTGEVRTVGYAGDRIQIADKTQDDDGTVWYSVRFDSGATGWVRSDFVNR